MLDPTMPPPMIATSAVRIMQGHCKWRTRSGRGDTRFKRAAATWLSIKQCRSAGAEENGHGKPSKCHDVGCSGLYLGDTGDPYRHQHHGPERENIERTRKSVENWIGRGVHKVTRIRGHRILKRE